MTYDNVCIENDMRADIYAAKHAIDADLIDRAYVSHDDVDASVVAYIYNDGSCEINSCTNGHSMHTKCDNAFVHALRDAFAMRLRIITRYGA